MNTKTYLHLLLIGALILAGCDGKGGGLGNESEPSFRVLTLKADTASTVESYTASVQGRQDVDVLPQVSGTIKEVCVHEGEKVVAGQRLFVIDQVPYQAALRMAVANVHAAKAQVATARLELESKQDLRKENVVSDYDVTIARNALGVAEAQLEQMQAAEINARNNLSYTVVKSPSAGRVGTLPWRKGALVSPSMTEPLTTVSDDAEMYVYFSLTENQLREIMRSKGSRDEALQQMPAVSLQLSDGTMYAHQGHIESMSGQIDRQTGSVQLKAVFPNEERLLVSGGIGNVVVKRQLQEVICIPQTCTWEIQDKVMVYKLVHGKTAVATQITVSPQHDGKTYIVLGGLTPGDRIVAENLEQIKEGMTINVKEE